MTSSLEAFFQDVAGFPMGLRKNRHFSIALQRRYLDHGAAKSGSVPTPEQLALERTLNHLRGHEKEVGDGNYAREREYGTSSVDERQRSRLLSELWHKALGFPTSYSEVMAREVVEAVTHRVVKNVRYGALKKSKKTANLKTANLKKPRKPRSSLNSRPRLAPTIVRPLRKARVARPIYLEVDSESGEEFDFGDDDTSEGSQADFESGTMVTVSKQSGRKETAPGLRGQQVASSSSQEMMSERSKMPGMLEGAQTVVPRVRRVRLIPLNEDPPPTSGAGRAEASKGQSSKRLKNKF